MTFNDFNFDQSLIDGLQSMGYKLPTPIQQQAIAPCGACNTKGTSIPEGSKCISCASSGFVSKEKVIEIGRAHV